MRGHKRTQLRKRFLLLFGAPWLVIALAWWWFGSDEREAIHQQAEETQKVTEISDVRAALAHELGPLFLQNQFPTETTMNWQGSSRKVKIDYSFDHDLQIAADKLLKSYHPDYGAVVILNANTGQVLTLSSFQKSDSAAPHLALRGTFPAASIFKIVTATAAVDKYHLSPETMINFNGANYTLYKKNVMETKRNRWTREMSIREAFARSINTVFGRLTFEKLQPADLQEYAIRFGFNQKIHSDLPVDSGFTDIPSEHGFHLAEMASGYNKITRMSPLQGAMIAASVAAEGRMPVPTVIDRVRDEEGKVLYKSEPVVAAVTMSPRGAERLKEMMESTILLGTSRKSFRPLVRDKKLRELELGGKTGHLTGDNPRGRVDWFVGYAIGGPDDRLAIATITVNIEKWTVKSAVLAQNLLQKHFKDQFTNGNAKFFRSAHRDDR